MFYFNLPSKPFKKEATFTSRFGKQIKQSGGFRHKISDADIRKKPADCIFALDGKQFLCEIKIGGEKNKTDIIKKLLPHQIVGLKKRYNNNGNSLIIYYNKVYNKYFCISYKGEDQYIINLKNLNYTTFA